MMHYQIQKKTAKEAVNKTYVIYRKHKAKWHKLIQPYH